MPTLGNNLDAALYQLVRARLENLSADPSFSSAERGRLWVTSAGQVKVNDGTAFVTLRDSGDPIVDGDVAASAAIALSKLAVNPLVRANHTGTQTASTISDFATAAQGAVGSAITSASTEDRKRSNHTGVQAASTISDLAGVVKAYRLDEFAVPSPGITMPMNQAHLANLGDPLGDRDAVPKFYVDNAVQGLSAKASVRRATTGNIDLDSTPATLDGVYLGSGMRLLVKDQTNPTENGIYVAGRLGLAMVRSADANGSGSLTSAFTFVEEGDTQADTGWLCTADSTASYIGTSAFHWVQFSSAGQITAGDGLTKAGQVLSVADDGVSLESQVSGTLPIVHGGTGATTAVAARFQLAAAGRHVMSTHPAGTTITIPASVHGLTPTPALVVSTRMIATGEEVLADTSVDLGGTVTVVFGVLQGSNTIRTTIIG